MADELNTPTKASLGAYIKAVWQGVRPDADTSRGSDVWLWRQVLGGALHRIHLSARLVLKALHPKTTFGVWLDWWLRWVCGEGIRQAAGSTGTSALSVAYTGSPGVCLGAQLLDSGGRRYQVASELTGGGSPELVDVVAVDTGLATNLEAGDTLDFIAAPLNVTTEATLATDLDGGREKETDAEGRARLLARLAAPILSGHPSQLRDVAEKAAQGTLRAYVFPKREGYPYGWGTVDVAVLQLGESGGDRIPTSTQVALVEVAIEANLPADTWYNHRMLTVVEQQVDLEFKYQLKDGASVDKACDWDAYTIQATADASSSATNRVTADVDICAPAVTGGLQVGHRVHCNGAEAIVSAVSVGADDKVFEVATWPSAWGVTDGLAGMWIQSGGGCTDAVRAAMVALADSLGPARGNGGLPDYTVADATDTDWEDVLSEIALRTAGLEADSAILDVTGISWNGGDPTSSGDLRPDGGIGATVNMLSCPPAMVTIWEDKG